VTAVAPIAGRKFLPLSARLSAPRRFREARTISIINRFDAGTLIAFILMTCVRGVHDYEYG
jgi:hypothetical protein